MARLRTREDYLDPLNHSVRFYSKGTISKSLGKQIDNPPDYTKMATRKPPVPGKSEKADLEYLMAGLIVHFENWQYSFGSKKCEIRFHLINECGKKIEWHEKRFIGKIIKWMRDAFERRMEIKCRNCPANK